MSPNLPYVRIKIIFQLQHAYNIALDTCALQRWPCSKTNHVESKALFEHKNGFQWRDSKLYTPHNLHMTFDSLIKISTLHIINILQCKSHQPQKNYSVTPIYFVGHANKVTFELKPYPHCANILLHSRWLWEREKMVSLMKEKLSYLQ